MGSFLKKTPCFHSLIYFKYILFVFAILSSSESFSQKKIFVEYTFSNYNIYKEYSAELIVDNFHATYRVNLENKSPEYNSGNILIGNLKDQYVISDLKQKSIAEYRQLDNEILKINEAIPNLIWNLNFNETKKISNRLCNKATTNFRGRHYTVWYCKEIPSFFGPWKLHGLPGLILEISDSKKEFLWIAKKIVFPSTEELSVPFDKFKEITLKEFVKRKTERLKRLRSRARTILPRDAEISVPKNSRKGLELIYEWEK